jgi:hypothetical protein
VIFTGHSAGGAVAAYVYKVLYEEGLKEEQEGKTGAYAQEVALLA